MRSIFLAARYFFRRRRSTRWRRTHRTFVGILLSRVPRRLPGPVWRPSRLAYKCLRARALECTFCLRFMMRPSLISLRTKTLEFACPICSTSLGSIQTRLLPHLSTWAANLFWLLRLTIDLINKLNNTFYFPFSFFIICSITVLCP